MNKNFFAWFFLITSLFFLWSLSQQRAALQQQEAQARQALEAEKAEIEREKARASRDALIASGEIPSPIVQPLQFFTLGSMDANDPRNLLITLTNAGAAVDRVELMGRDGHGRYNYRSLDNRFGYPGYLAFTERAGGLQINSVPPGSPAAVAHNSDPTLPDGLLAGDVLVAVNEQQVRTLIDYYNAMDKHNAGTAVKFSIVRGAAEKSVTAEVDAADLDSLLVKSESSTDVNPADATEPASEIEESPSDAALSAPAATTEGTSNELPTDAAAAPIAIAPAIEGPQMVFTIDLQEQPLDIVRNTNHYPAEQVDGNEQRPSLLTTFASIGDLLIPEGKRAIPGMEDLETQNWIGSQSDDGNTVTFELPLRPFLVAAGIDADLTMVKTYSLVSSTEEGADTRYDFVLNTSVRNNRDEPIEFSLRQEGFSGINLEGWWYINKQSTGFMNAAGARDVALSRSGGGLELITRSTIQHAGSNVAAGKESSSDVLILGPGDSPENRNLDFIGIDSQYFIGAIQSSKDNPKSLTSLARAAAFPLAKLPGNGVAVKGQLNPDQAVAMNVGFYFDTPSVSVTKDQAYATGYRVVACPKEPDLLDKYQLSDVNYYGWSIFAFVAKPLSAILHFFYSIVRNYGIAIMMLTVLVRSLMFPLSWRAGAMGQRMQELAPELKKINEAYKDDFQKRGVETQKLYKKYKINPMASCLPLFIQLPIFIGLYRSVSTDVVLRQKALVSGWEWCNNLAGPDQFALWPTWMPEFIAGKGTGWLGPYINLLPIITCALFIIQQKVLMPKATDEQTRMTQRIMMFMTVFMGIMFFRVPAGLCIYFITSSIWSLVERKMVKKFLPPAQVAADSGVIEIEPYKPQKSAPVRRGNDKPPEKLSELFPWLKRQMSRDNPNAKQPEDVSTNARANRDKRRDKKKR